MSAKRETQPAGMAGRVFEEEVSLKELGRNQRLATRAKIGGSRCSLAVCRTASFQSGAQTNCTPKTVAIRPHRLQGHCRAPARVVTTWQPLDAEGCLSSRGESFALSVTSLPGWQAIRPRARWWRKLRLGGSSAWKATVQPNSLIRSSPSQSSLAAARPDVFCPLFVPRAARALGL